jgi:hypothetical protein
MISLSGNFLGQMNAWKPFLYCESTVGQEMSASWEASYSSCSYGGYSGLDSVDAMVTTYTGTAQETRYSPKVRDMQALFDSVNRSRWSRMLGAVYPSMDRKRAPEAVNVYCLYGSNVTTSYGFTFAGTILSAEPTETLYTDGDGNQDIIDNTFCLSWENSVNAQGGALSATKKTFSFYAQAFPGVSHMEMVSDPDVLAEIHDILFNEQ